jgi:hypothetical protein
VFLAGPTGITEFVVTSDLDRHAIRCYLYFLLSELEMHMADHLDASTITHDEIRTHFQARDRRRYESARDRGLETRPAEYLVFSAYEKLAPDLPTFARCFPGQTVGPGGLLGATGSTVSVTAGPFRRSQSACRTRLRHPDSPRTRIQVLTPRNATARMRGLGSARGSGPTKPGPEGPRLRGRPG